MDDERTENEETKDMAETSAPAEETTEPTKETDPSKEMMDAIAALRDDIASFKDSMGSIREMLGALADQKSVDESIGAEDEAYDDDGDEDEYPEYDLDDLAKTIGGI